jgi:thiamine biosynthesis lipoprotein
MRLDLGGIAKGTIVDAVGEVLLGRGVTAFLVNAGGDMLARGDGPDGDGILVDVRDPRAAPGETLAGQRLRLRDLAVCTSGSYARGSRVAGRRVSHIVDPASGRPVADDVLQATVVAPRCETADALATALMVRGRAGLSLVAARDGVEALVVVREKDADALAATPGFGALRAESAR